MALKRATNPIQTQLLLEMGVPADTADIFFDEGENGNLLSSRIAWTVDALIDYLCDGDNAIVYFRRDKMSNFWVCSYTRYEGKEYKNKIDVSKMAPTKIDAIFEVIYELKRGK